MFVSFLEDVGEYGGESAGENLVEFVGYSVGSRGFARREEVHGVSKFVCAYGGSTLCGCGREHFLSVSERVEADVH